MLFTYAMQLTFDHVSTVIKKRKTRPNFDQL